jgi:hypothetical protein
MNQTVRHPGLRLVSGWVAASLVVVAAALLLVSIGELRTADLLRIAPMVPDASNPDADMAAARAAGAAAEALVAIVLAGAVLLRPGRASFGLTALFSAIAMGTGAWVAIDVSVLFGPGIPLPVRLGSFVIDMPDVGIALAMAGLSGLVGSVAGLAASPVGIAPPVHMPPPTHQG